MHELPAVSRTAELLEPKLITEQILADAAIEPFKSDWETDSTWSQLGFRRQRWASLKLRCTVPR